ncbi:MAG TPA: transposase [Solirubrobacteraceae bacterium]|jgi:hypothetical protein|nr:transposase [Solirubrobacteraceae bacterium]
MSDNIEGTANQASGTDGAGANGGAERRGRKRVRTQARPGFTNRKHRREIEKAVIRSRLLDVLPDPDDVELERRVEADYQLLLPSDPNELRFFNETGQVSVSPNRRGKFEFIEAHAMRGLPLMRELEELLCEGKGMGRGTDRRLFLAAFERNCFEAGRPEVIRHWREFQTSNDPLAWAYGWPARDGSNRDQSNVYRMLHDTLDRCSSDICLVLNIRALVALRQQLGDDGKDIGRYLVLDGTDIPAAREEKPARVPEEEELIRRQLTFATLASHGANKYWRGGLLLCLTDVKSGLVLGFVLVPGNSDEAALPTLRELLRRIHATWELYAGEPWEPEYLTADSAFNENPLHSMLEAEFAIHPVTPLATNLGSAHAWAENDGTPCCAQHGDLKHVQNQYFVTHAKRRELGLRPGDEADMSKAGARWVCTGRINQTAANPEGDPCPVKATTRWARNPTAYPFLPHKGQSRTYVPLRRALMRRRNVSESTNAKLKGRGIGQGGMNVPRWVRTDNEFRWLVHSTLLAFTLQRLVHENGFYRRSHQEAEERGYLTPSQPSPHPSVVPLDRAFVAVPGTDARRGDDDELLDFDRLVA